jgi:hypothetical protein
MLIGSHCSGSYTVNYDIDFWSDDPFNKWNILRKSMQYLPCFYNRIERIFRIQRFNIYDQLIMGIRVLDLQVSFSENTGKFYTSNVFCGEELSIVLADIYRFLHDITAADDTDESYGSNGSGSEDVLLLHARDQLPQRKREYNISNLGAGQNIEIVLIVREDPTNKSLQNKEYILESILDNALKNMQVFNDTKVMCYFNNTKYIQSINALDIIDYNATSISEFVEKYNNDIRDLNNNHVLIFSINCSMFKHYDASKQYVLLRTNRPYIALFDNTTPYFIERILPSVL